MLRTYEKPVGEVVTRLHRRAFETQPEDWRPASVPCPPHALQVSLALPRPSPRWAN